MKCWTCGGLHLAKLYGKGHCPNDVAEANGTAAQNKQTGVRCTYWIDKARTPCGGTHSWEDHRAALLKFAPPKGKGKPSEKGKGKGKGKDQSHSLTEPPKEGEAGESALTDFIQAAGWWQGESFAALTDARSSGDHASSSQEMSLEPECSKRLSATSQERNETRRDHWSNCGSRCPTNGCRPCSEAGQLCDEGCVLKQP